MDESESEELDQSTTRMIIVDLPKRVTRPVIVEFDDLPKSNSYRTHESSDSEDIEVDIVSTYLHKSHFSGIDFITSSD